MLIGTAVETNPPVRILLPVVSTFARCVHIHNLRCSFTHLTNPASRSARISFLLYRFNFGESGAVSLLAGKEWGTTTLILAMGMHQSYGSPANDRQGRELLFVSTSLRVPLRESAQPQCPPDAPQTFACITRTSRKRFSLALTLG